MAEMDPNLKKRLRSTPTGLTPSQGPKRPVPINRGRRRRLFDQTDTSCAVPVDSINTVNIIRARAGSSKAAGETHFNIVNHVY